MQKEEAIREALALVNRSGIAMLGTNGDEGYPNIKAMIKMEWVRPRFPGQANGLLR